MTEAERELLLRLASEAVRRTRNEAAQARNSRFAAAHAAAEWADRWADGTKALADRVQQEAEQSRQIGDMSAGDVE